MVILFIHAIIGTITFRRCSMVLLFSIPLGVLIAVALQVHWKPLHYLINIYIWVMR
ncbi:amino acid ABC transporter permease, partial [Streptococcus pneumoniae]